MMTKAPSLTERRRLQTRDAIANAAIALFTSHGFDAVSMTDVADAAGVSRRTVYRYFPSKDDLVFEHPQRWFEYFERETAQGAPDESVRERHERVITELAEIVQADKEPVLSAFAVRMANPSLGARHLAGDVQWQAVVLAHLQAEDPNVSLHESMTCAGALIGATNATIAAWALAQPDGHLPTMIRAALSQVGGIWPNEPSN